MKKKKILFYGVGTYKNKGIEAIVQSTLQQINKNEYEISTASHDKEYNEKFYTKEIKKYINHYKKSAELTDEEKELENHYKQIPFDYNNFELLYQNDVVKEMEKSDICVSVGGDNYCYDFCTWLYALDKKSHDLGKKTILWGVSLFEEITDPELINNLKNYDVIVIRESLSYNAVKEFVPEEKILFRPDPAFSLEVKKENLNDWYKRRKFVTLNLSPLTIEKEEQYKEVENLVNYILEKTDYSICLLPHVTTEDCNDLDILDKIKKMYKSEERVYLETETYNCNQLKYIISLSEILIAARTHASIAAYSTEVPTLVIGYSVKSRGIAKDIFGTIENYVLPKGEIRDNKLVNSFKYIDENKEKIKKVLKEKMPLYREQAKNIWPDLIKKIDEIEKLKICERTKCIGCGLCSLKCPKNAIKMESDINGFIYPKIDLKKCINCDLCRKDCPINNKKQDDSNDDRTYYAAKAKDNEIRSKSSSGGIFSVLANYILENKGIVYGCQLKDSEASHIRISKKQDLDKIRGSKYIQSSIVQVLEEVKTDLINKKSVLFCGTPCQIGALKKYLKKDYKNLLTVSVACHGVMNDKILKKQIEELENQTKEKINEINFRTKENGWTKSSIKYIFDTKSIVNTFLEDNLMSLYLDDLVTRDSCFNCQYKGKNDESDITIGDYWGIEITNKEFLDEQGISVIIINTEKGRKIFEGEAVQKNLKLDLGNKEAVLKYNPNLVKSINYQPRKELVLNSIRKEGLKVTSLNNKNNKLEKELEKQREICNALKWENEKKDNELLQIRNSTRWKIIDKTANITNKLLRRKRTSHKIEK